MLCDMPCRLARQCVPSLPSTHQAHTKQHEKYKEFSQSLARHILIKLTRKQEGKPSSFSLFLLIFFPKAGTWCRATPANHAFLVCSANKHKRTTGYSAHTSITFIACMRGCDTKKTKVAEQAEKPKGKIQATTTTRSLCTNTRLTGKIRRF